MSGQEGSQAVLVHNKRLYSEVTPEEHAVVKIALAMRGERIAEFVRRVVMKEAYKIVNERG